MALKSNFDSIQITKINFIKNFSGDRFILLEGEYIREILNAINKQLLKT